MVLEIVAGVLAIVCLAGGVFAAVKVDHMMSLRTYAELPRVSVIALRSFVFLTVVFIALIPVRVILIFRSQWP